MNEQRGGLRLVDGKWKLEWREDVVLADAVLTQSGINALDYRPGRMATFGELAVMWERDVLALSKPSTQAADRSRLKKHLRPALEGVKLEAIHTQLVQALVRRWTEEGLSPKSVRNLVVMLQGMLKTAREWGFTAAEVKIRVKMPARRLRPRGRRFSIEEARTIVALAPDPWNVFFTVAALTGLHAFRQLHGTALISVGANPKVAQAQLGHADTRTTMELYVGVVGKDHREAVEKVASILALNGAGRGSTLVRVM